MKTVLVTTSSFAKVDNAPLETLKKNGFEVFLNPFGRKLTEEEVDSLVQEYKPDALLAGVEPLTSTVMEKAAPRLKVISRCGIGLDSVDIKAAEKYGIIVTNTPDAPTIPVTELTIGMILGLLRQIHVTDKGIREGRWVRPMGGLLYKKTVGIIGCGRIGTRLARMLKAFECDVLGCDIILEHCDDCRLVNMDELLSVSDIVSLHLSYSVQTHHIINKQRLAQMKKGAYLVNAARGGLVDEVELYKVLKSDHLAGAAIDCFELEPYNGPLKELNNVLLTGHIGSYAREGRLMMEMQAVGNLLAALKPLERRKRNL